VHSFIQEAVIFFVFLLSLSLSLSLSLYALHFPLIFSHSRVSVRREIVYSPGGGMFDKEKR